MRLLELVRPELSIQELLNRRPYRLPLNAQLQLILVFILLFFGRVPLTTAAETMTTLDLVAEDAAFCLEVPDLNSTCSKLESDPLMGRLRAFPPYQRLLESPGYQHWKMVEEQVSKQSGSKLSSQLRALFGKSLVLAIYVRPATGPQGILIGEANDPAAIESALATWNKLDTSEIMTTKTYRGRRYYHRKKNASGAQSVYIASSDRWFAVSDHESLIQEIMDRYVSITSTTGGASGLRSIRYTPKFTQNRRKLNGDGKAYAYISARPWDRVFEESPKNPGDPIDPAAVWKHVSSVSSCLRIDRGVSLESVIELDTTRLPSEWAQFVSTASRQSSWIHRIPAEALLGISGRIEISPAIQKFLSLMQPNDLTDLAKARRIAQSLFGGNELLDLVLPMLARDFGGYVTTRTDDQTKKVMLDGVLGFTLDSSGDSGLLKDIDHGLETLMSLLAAYLSSESKSLVTVQREELETAQLRSLSDTVPFPVAYAVKGPNLVVAGSRERLKQSLDSLDAKPRRPRLDDHATRFFPGTNQMIWIDAARTRNLLTEHPSDVANLLSRGSTDAAAEITPKLEHVRLLLAVIDSLFIAGRVESDHIRIVVGGGLDSE